MILKKEPVIVGGCPRSGTTLLRTMLNSHPDLYAGPECGITTFIANSFQGCWDFYKDREAELFGFEKDDFLESYRFCLENFYDKILRNKSDRQKRIIDKMPQNIEFFPTLSEILPKSKFIHVIRDGRAVCNSIFKNKEMFHDEQGNTMKFAQYSYLTARYWKKQVIQPDSIENSNRYIKIFYENLVRYPEQELKKLVEFIGEKWNSDILNYYYYNHEIEPNREKMYRDVLQPTDTDTVDKWKSELSEEQIEEIEFEISDVLKKFRYK